MDGEGEVLAVGDTSEHVLPAPARVGNCAPMFSVADAHLP